MNLRRCLYISVVNNTLSKMLSKVLYIFFAVALIIQGNLNQVFASGKSRGGRLRELVKTESDTVGEKLILTPFILEGKTEEAKAMSRVRNLTLYSTHNLEVESYSGFLTVNSKLNSNLFFWFVPAMNNSRDAPVMLWLNGGPGSTSMVAFFTEHGPYIVEADMSLKRRDISWTNSHSIIYMDNPVGAGFSFTEDDAGYPRFIEDATTDLYAGLEQFFTIFTEYQKQEFYVAGQSYAGKYAPCLAHKIHEANKHNPSVKINLQGISVGSGFFDPVSQLNYADFYYQTGLIDESQRDYFHQQEELTRNLIDAKNWSQAFVVMETLIVGYPTPYGTSHFETVTGIKYDLNILYEEEPEQNGYYSDYLNQTSVRRAIHVGNQKFVKFNAKVYNLMHEDIYQSIKPKLIDLLNADYKVLIYTSQFDAIVPYTTVNNFVNSLSWKKSEEYMKAEREIWRTRDKGDLAGYVKKAGNFCFALIRNSGHLAPQDQPDWTLDMINNFTRKSSHNFYEV